MSKPFYETVTELLRADPAIRRLGFDPEKDIKWSAKGADRNDLMQVARHDRWMIPADDAIELGYQGVCVHYESCRPGHWCVHCELYPRLGKAAKAQVKEHPELLERKKVITEELRALGVRDKWSSRFGAHLKGARPDAADPSSLIVYTFELGLGPDCTPEEFTAAIVPIITGTIETIDARVVSLARRLASG